MVGGRPVTGNLDVWFKSLMVVDGRGKIETGAKLGWKNLPLELLLRILVLGDVRMVIAASGVCTGWRDAICLRFSHLFLSCVVWLNSTSGTLAPARHLPGTISREQHQAGATRALRRLMDVATGFDCALALAWCSLSAKT